MKSVYGKSGVRRPYQRPELRRLRMIDLDGADMNTGRSSIRSGVGEAALTNIAIDDIELDGGPDGSPPIPPSNQLR